MKLVKYIISFLLAVSLSLVFYGAAYAEQVNSEEKQLSQEFSINRKGKVQLIGATVQDIGSGSMTVKIWDMNVSVIISSSTKMVRKFGGKSNVSVSEFSAGDTVNVSGKFVSASPLTVDASVIRDKSIHKTKHERAGIVQFVSETGLVLKTEKGDEFTVTPLADAEIKAGKEIKTLSDIKAGDKVTVSGVINTQKNTILATKIKIKIKVEIETIRNQKVKVNKEGMIDSINAEEKSFVLRPETGGDIIVKINDTTIRTIRKEGAIKQFTDLKVGDRVEVNGRRDAEDASSTVITAIRITIK